MGDSRIRSTVQEIRLDEYRDCHYLGWIVPNDSVCFGALYDVVAKRDAGPDRLGPCGEPPGSD